MKNDLTTETRQDNIWCPINIIFLCTSDVGCPNIVAFTCLLTIPVALRRSQHQVMAGPLWGSRRSCKTPNCHHHYQFHHHCLYCPPCRHRKTRKTLAEIMVHECNRVLPRSLLQIFNPHDVGQWSRELVGLELEPRIRSWANLGGRCCYFVKSKHLHHPHHPLIIHLPRHCCKGISNEQEHWAAVNVGELWSRVLAHCGGWRHRQWTKSGKTTWEHLCGTS